MELGEHLGNVNAFKFSLFSGEKTQIYPWSKCKTTCISCSFSKFQLLVYFLGMKQANFKPRNVSGESDNSAEKLSKFSRSYVDLFSQEKMKHYERSVTLLSEIEGFALLPSIFQS